MALIVDIADAVTADLNAPGSFTPALSAERQYRPRRDLRELAELKVTVVPRAVSFTGATRSAQSIECKVDIAVQKKVADDANATIDPLMSLVEEIVNHLSRRRLTLPGDIQCAWVGVESDPIYLVEHLDELQVFTAVVTVTYRVVR